MLKYAYELGVALALEEEGVTKDAGIMNWFANLFGKKPLTQYERFGQKYVQNLAGKPATAVDTAAYKRRVGGIRGQQATGGTGVPGSKGVVYNAPTGGGVG